MIRQGKTASGGFSLLEFSIVLAILGIMIAGAVGMYELYRQQVALERNANSLRTMKGAIDSYFVKYHHYPCPAPRTATQKDANYGRSLNCNDKAAADYRLITRNIDLDGDGVAEPVRIREGMLPFMDLAEFLADEGSTHEKPSGSNTLDAYNRFFTYVVTEHQATDQYGDKAGAILLRDEHDRDVANNANFLLISHGANGAGARITQNNTFLPCSGAGKDLENCDGDYEYIHGLQYHAPGDNYYDDQIGFLQWMPYHLWEVTKNNPNNFHNINPGYVGIGVKDPDDQLHLKDGNMLAYRFWDSANPGSTLTQSLCKGDSNETDCFPPELIGGDIFPGCDADEIMTGIAESAPICQPAFVNAFAQPCPNPQEYICGMSYYSPSKTIQVRCKNPAVDRSSGC